MPKSHYMHVLDGRFRIRVPEIRGSSQRADEVEQFLMGVVGITEVTVNPLTGSVLVYYQPRKICHRRIYSLLRSQGYLQRAPGPSGTKPSEVIAEFVLKSPVEKALSSLIPVFL